jgi:hypothetical protein
MLKEPDIQRWPRRRAREKVEINGEPWGMLTTSDICGGVDGESEAHGFGDVARLAALKKELSTDLRRFTQIKRVGKEPLFVICVNL